MALFVMAIPLPADKVSQWRGFLEELNGARKAEFVANRKALGVRERTFHQQTPHGDLIIVTLEGDDAANAMARFGQGTDSFTQWFKGRVLEIHGVDLSAPPPGPMPSQVIDSGA